MASAYPAPVSAVQVGSYFVGQYYQVLQQQPDFVHQFYNDSSTMLRVDGNTSESASAMLQIHSLIMSLNFTGIEIKTANSLESWNRGVIVMVSGSVQTKDYNGRRKFVQTFFLAPQEKGYFVLNDIFHFLDEEQIQQHPAAILAQNHFESALNTPNPISEPVSDYTIEADSQPREFVVSGHVEESDSVDKYSIPDQQQQQQVPEVENIVEETPVEEITTSFPHLMNPVQESSTVPVEEPVGEPQKQTYASILRTKGQSASTVPQRYTNRSAPTTSEWHQAPQPTPQQSYPVTSTGFERPSAATVDRVPTPEDEGEGRSVYVRNLPPTISSFDIEQEFKNFGVIKPEGVVIRNRKDVDVCYAFVEFEDAVGVQNAIQASPIQLGGRQVHIEERRANSSSTSRGGRRGRGRGGYQTESVRGRYGGGGRSSYGRASGGQDGGSESRSRGNGYQRGVPRQERGILGNQSEEAGY